MNGILNYMAASNWRRGIVRLWFVISIFWAVGAIFVLRPDYSVAELSKLKSDVARQRADVFRQSQYFEDEEKKIIVKIDNVYGKLMEFAAVVISVPIILLVLRFAIEWIVIGFRHDVVGKPQ